MTVLKAGKLHDPQKLNMAAKVARFSPLRFGVISLTHGMNRSISNVKMFLSATLLERTVCAELLGSDDHKGLISNGKAKESNHDLSEFSVWKLLGCGLRSVWHPYTVIALNIVLKLSKIKETQWIN